MSDPNKLPRRSFLEKAAAGVVASRLAAGVPAFAQTRVASTPLKRLDPLKSIEAGVLNVGYAELGPVNGAPILLLHGWPYDIHTYAEVAPAWPLKGTESSSRMCAAMAQRGSFPAKRPATVNRRFSPLTSLR